MGLHGPRLSVYPRNPGSAESEAAVSTLSPCKESAYAHRMSKLFNAIRSIGFRRGPQRLLGGIAGGIAEGMQANVWLVRLILLIACLLPVIGVGLYLVIWALTPWQDGSIPLERALDSRAD